MSFNIRSIIGSSPRRPQRSEDADSSRHNPPAISHPPLPASVSTTADREPPASSSLPSLGQPRPATTLTATVQSPARAPPIQSSAPSAGAGTAIIGNVHATLSCGQDSQQLPRIFQSSGRLTQNDGCQYTLSPLTQGPVYQYASGPLIQGARYPGPSTQGSGQWTWDPLLALQQAAVTQDSCPQNPLFIPSGKKRSVHYDSSQGPSRKKPRYFDTQVVVSSDSESDSDDEGDNLAEPFDPHSFYTNPAKNKLPEPLEKYIQTHFRSCLSHPVRKAMAKENPLPSSVALKCLEADDAIVDFMGKNFPTKIDKQYKRMQSATIAAAAPALGLWKELEEQGFTSEQGGLVPASTVLDTLQRSVVLIGNASNYVSQVRRDNIIRRLETQNKGLASTLKSICKKHQPEDDLLFGSQVCKALNQRAETLDSFRKVATKVAQSQSSFRSSGKDKKFFREGPVRDHGHGSGRIFRPSNQYQQSHQQSHQQNYQRNRRPNFQKQKFTPKTNQQN